MLKSKLKSCKAHILIRLWSGIHVLLKVYFKNMCIYYTESEKGTVEQWASITNCSWEKIQNDLETMLVNEV